MKFLVCCAVFLKNIHPSLFTEKAKAVKTHLEETQLPLYGHVRLIA